MSNSLRLAIFAFALTTWLDGTAQLRFAVSGASVFDEPSFFAAQSEEHERTEIPDAGLNAFSRWMRRRARRMDRVERLFTATLDVTTAAGLLHILQTRPLFPFLLTPLLSTIPLPRTLKPRNVSFPKVLITSLALCLVHQLERVAIVRALAIWRQEQDLKHGASFERGSVFARGERLPAPPEADIECLICSDMANSVAAASVAGDDDGEDEEQEEVETRTRSLGPLEAFCTLAPTKHVAHRECFLRWHAVYESQRHLRTPQTVLLVDDGKDGSQSTRRAKALLHAAGFAYLIVSTRSRRNREPSSAQEPFQPTLALHPPSTTAHPRLATLLTQCPPCPGCRSAVSLHFCADDSHPNTSRPKRTFGWLEQASGLVTGRSVVIKFGTQLSFLAAVISMLRARERMELTR